MSVDFIHHYLKTFFKENDCDVNMSDGKLVVGLSEDMDKALMNRPFYWKYMETMNQKGVPMKLTLLTDKEKREEKGEWITYGSPRLQQIGQYLRNQAQFTRLFQVKDTQIQTMLQPWLVVNYCVRYQGKQTKEKIFSIGLHLINGTIVSGMMEKLHQIELNEVISNHCYTISPIIKPGSGFLRIEKYIDAIIEKDEHQWAVDSHEQLQAEVEMIHYFYQEKEVEEEIQQEINAAKKRFSPRITHEVISGGLFYLDENF